MIPKIIHYCWFGGGQKPESVERNISQWKQILFDYVFVEWNENNFDVNYNRYVQEAYKNKKYAFVSDVCRLYALKQQGGVYLDTDVEVLKRFDSFLMQHSFIGEEQNGLLLGTAVIGALRESVWVQDFLKSYENIRFEITKTKFNDKPNTIRITDFLKKYDGEKPRTYPVDFFCAKDYKTKKVLVTDNTVCIHHYAESWVVTPRYKRIESIFWNVFGLKNLNILGKLYWKILVPIKKIFQKEDE